jgi:hypothetical protein
MNAKEFLRPTESKIALFLILTSLAVLFFTMTPRFMGSCVGCRPDSRDIAWEIIASPYTIALYAAAYLSACFLDVALRAIMQGIRTRKFW